MEVTTNKKVLSALKRQGRSKTWLAKELNISRVMLYQRLKDNLWYDYQIKTMREIGLI